MEQETTEQQHIIGEEGRVAIPSARQIASDGALGSGARYPWRCRPSTASPGNQRRCELRRKYITWKRWIRGYAFASFHNPCCRHLFVYVRVLQGWGRFSPLCVYVCAFLSMCAFFYSGKLLIYIYQAGNIFRETVLPYCQLLCFICRHQVVRVIDWTPFDMITTVYQLYIRYLKDFFFKLSNNALLFRTHNLINR